VQNFISTDTTTSRTTTVLRPFIRDHPAEPVPEENFWTLWCNGRYTEADTLTIRLGATPSELTSAHLHHPPHIFYRPDDLPAGQPCQSTEGISTDNKLQKLSPTVLKYSLLSRCNTHCITISKFSLHTEMPYSRNRAQVKRQKITSN